MSKPNKQLPRKATLMLPNMATLTSLMLGVLSIMVLQDQQFLLAATLILLGSILDVLDGQMAERFDAQSAIGKELDSLADMVTFGVAPTLLVYHLLLMVGVDKYLAILSSLSFVLAGAFRLARFNVMLSDRDAYFKGMPIPMASALLITASFWRQFEINIWWTALMIIMSYLMVSPFPYPKFSHLTKLPNQGWILIVALVLVSFSLGGWQAVPFGLMLLYAVSGPVLFALLSKQKRMAEL